MCTKLDQDPGLVHGDDPESEWDVADPGALHQPVRPHKARLQQSLRKAPGHAVLGRQDEFVAGGVQNFYIPWVQIIVIGGLAFLASLLMTIIPSRQASGIPIAEALRYE